MTALTLEPLSLALAELVCEWACASGELSPWTPPPTSDDFQTALADSSIRPYVARADGQAVAFGELWTEPDGIELARIIVDPALRRRGIGTRLVLLLLEEAARMAAKQAWVRVVPQNTGALACYTKVGFAYVSAADENRFNEGQQRVYRWLRYDLAPQGKQPRSGPDSFDRFDENEQ